MGSGTYAHAYVIELDQNLVEKAFRKRKKRKIGSIELYLSVMPQDVPRVRIKGVAEEKKILVEFEPGRGSWGSVLAYRDEQSGLEVYQDFASGYVRTVKFSVDKIKEFQSKISEVRQKVEEELANMEWEGRKVAQLDMKERQFAVSYRTWSNSPDRSFIRLSVFSDFCKFAIFAKMLTNHWQKLRMVS